MSSDKHKRRAAMMHLTFPEFLFQSHTGAYRIKPDGTEVGNKAYQLLPQKIECAIKDGLDLGIYGALREYKGIDPNTRIQTPPSGKYTTVWLSSEDREAEYLQKFYSSINTTTNPPTLRRGIELKCNNKTCRNTIFGSFIIDVERKTITCGRCWEVNNYSIHRLP